MILIPDTLVLNCKFDLMRLFKSDFFCRQRRISQTKQPTWSKRRRTSSLVPPEWGEWSQSENIGIRCSLDVTFMLRLLVLWKLPRVMNSLHQFQTFLYNDNYDFRIYHPEFGIMFDNKVNLKTLIISVNVPGNLSNAKSIHVVKIQVLL